MASGESVVSDPVETLFRYVSETCGPWMHLMSLRSLLQWERPYLSALALVSLSVLYWTAIFTSSAIYSLLALVTIGVFLFRTWLSHCPKTSVSPDEEILKWFKLEPELSQYASEYWSSVYQWGKRLWSLRQKEPSQFCKLGCYAFSLLLLLGQMFPTTLVMYSLVVMAFASPVINFYLKPTEFLQQLLASIDAETQELESVGSLRKEIKLVASETIATYSDIHHASLIEKLLVPDQEDKGGGGEGSTEVESMQISTTEAMYAECRSEDDLTRLPSEEKEMLQLSFKGESCADSPLELEDLYDKPTTSQQSSFYEEAIHFVPTHFKEDTPDDEEQDLQHVIYSSQYHESNGQADDTVEGSHKFQLLPHPAFDEHICEKSNTSHPVDGGSVFLEGSSGPRSPSRKSSQSSEIDISEYDIVSETELES